MIPSLIALGVVAAVIGVFAVVSVRQNERTSGFLEAARTQALRSRVQLELVQGKHAKLTLSVDAADRGQFEVRREGAADRFAEGLSLARRIRTPDPAFGDRFHIDSDDEPFAAAFFSDAGKRSAVEALFAAGCTSLEWDEGRAVAVWQGFQPKDENADFVGAASSALRALTVGVPASAPPSAVEAGLVEKTFNAYMTRAFLIGFVAFFATTALHRSLPGRPVRGWELFQDSLRVSVPLAVVFVAGVLARVRGKSWFLKAAGQLIFASLLLFPSLGYVGYAWANSFLDASLPASYVLPVTGKYRTGGKHASYYVTVAPWGLGQGESFEVDYSTFVRAQQGRTRAFLTTRPGRLGHEWIVSLEFSDS